MNAPDKIYLAPNPPMANANRDGFVGLAWNSKDDILEPEEYIRKDALLEWAKEREKDTYDAAGVDDMVCGYHDAIMDLIEKLNSL